MSTVALFVSHRTKPGMRDKVRAVWMKHMAPAIEGNPDHLAYFYSFDSQDPDAICAFQKYGSAESARQFLENPNYKAYLAEVGDLLAGPPEIRNLLPQWVKGA